MSIIFSRSCEYAIQATVYLAQRTDRSPIQVREISDSLRIPHHFLSKVLQILGRDGIVLSHKGLNGGFELGRPAAQIALIDIVRAIDGEAFFDHCVFGLPKCDPDHPCPLHPKWSDAKALILAMLRNQSVAELANGLNGHTRAETSSGIFNRTSGVES